LASLPLSLRLDIRSDRDKTFLKYLQETPVLGEASIKAQTDSRLEQLKNEVSNFKPTLPTVTYEQPKPFISTQEAKPLPLKSEALPDVKPVDVLDIDDLLNLPSETQTPKPQEPLINSPISISDNSELSGDNLEAWLDSVI
jgi:hypothetical protein